MRVDRTRCVEEESKTAQVFTGSGPYLLHNAHPRPTQPSILVSISHSRQVSLYVIFSGTQPDNMCMLNNCLEWDKWVLNELIPLQTVV